MSDVSARMNHMQRSNSQPASIRPVNESLVVQAHGASNRASSRRETPLGAAAPVTSELYPSQEERNNLPKVSTSEEPKKPKRKEKSKNKSSKASAGEVVTTVASPTDSIVRGMLEDEISEQEVQSLSATSCNIQAVTPVSTNNTSAVIPPSNSAELSSQTSQSTSQVSSDSQTIPRTKSKEFL